MVVKALLLSMVFLSFSVLTAAAGTPANVEGLLRQAKQAYDSLEYEKALALLERAEALEGKDRLQLLKLLKLKVLTLSVLDKPVEEYYRRILCLDPGFEPESGLSPKMRQPFDRVQAARPQPLQLAITPPAQALVGKEIVFSVEKQDDCNLVETVRLYWRFSEEGKYASLGLSLVLGRKGALRIGSDSWPAGFSGDRLFWYAQWLGRNRTVLWEEGGPENPLVILVGEPKLSRPVVATLTEPPTAVAEVVPWYSRWWVWVVAGAALAAAGVTTAVLLSGGSAGGPINVLVDFPSGP